MENAVALFGSFDSNIKLIEHAFGVRITCRGSELKVEGEAEQAAKATTVIESLLQFLSRGEALSEQNVRYCIALVNAGSEEKIEQLAGDCICITSKGKPIKPKTIGQKRYCSLIAQNTITVGVGPAGTGKTYLAVAMAVTAFRSKQVNRIILTRPAVEAGEKLEDLETFHPDRMASRILGMGDVLTLIEDAQNKLDQKEAEKMAEKIMANRFDFNDLLGQFDQIKKMGPLKGILSKLPGVGKQLDDVDINDRQIDWLQAIIRSMTPAERENPSLLNPSRKRRIAAGSGRSVEEVNRLIKQLDQMQKMIKQLNKGGKKGKRKKKMMLPGLGGAPFDGMGGMGGNGMPF